ncbi:unnamed protein product [Dovyalis caffra]|uniref:GRAM domain-containing protein n=1 Tax=Dovyalis caffra TaxID=77055 RepID=A0AAV1RL68_9ROSI|nr:unnamed protein product [Dovyalis caffra]
MRKPRNGAPTSCDHQQHLTSTLTTNKLPCGLPLSTNKSLSILTTGPSVPETVWGKVNLTAKALTEGGFESLFKQIFETDPSEKLKKAFACYLSTSTGPVAGTLYLSTAPVAFCSDLPLCYTAPSGQEAWSYYKPYGYGTNKFKNTNISEQIMIPSEKISRVIPVIMKQDPPEKYLQIVTVDGHEFWFTDFVNFKKASRHLLESVSGELGSQFNRLSVSP